MSTFTKNVNFWSATEGEFRRWVKAIGDGLLAVGLVRTARDDDGAFAYASSESSGKDARLAFDGQENVVQTTTGTVNVEVSGGGDAGSNGIYPPNGSYNGATQYYKNDTYRSVSFGQHRAGHWTVFDEDYYRAVYHAPGTAAGGPSGAWFVDENFPSAAPAPSVAWAGGSGGTSNVASRWRSSAAPTAAAPQSLAYYAGESKTVSSYKIFHSGKDGDIKDWKYQTSDNGADWSDKDSRSAINVAEGAQSYDLSAPATAPYHRLLVTGRRGAVAYCEVIEWHLLDGTNRLPLPFNKKPDPNTNQYKYSESWRFSDAKQDEAPVFFKIAYGQNTGVVPGLQVTVSDRADFSRSRRFDVTTYSANAAETQPLLISGASDRLALSLGNHGYLSIERTRGGDGVQNSDGIAVHLANDQQGYPSRNANAKSTVINRASVLPDEVQFWISPYVPQQSRLDGLKTHLMPVYPFAKRLFAPTIGQCLYQRQDLDVDTVIDMTVYGQGRKYRATHLQTGINSQGGPGNENLAMLWE